MTQSARRALPKLTEAQITEQVIGWLRSKQWECVRLQSGLMRTKDGRPIRIGKKNIPDWICTKRERYFYLELKRPGETLSAGQLGWFAEARLKKLNAMWADSFGGFLAKFEIATWAVER